VKFLREEEAQTTPAKRALSPWEIILIFVMGISGGGLTTACKSERSQAEGFGGVNPDEGDFGRGGWEGAALALA
jgi:hypothetical protein